MVGLRKAKVALFFFFASFGAACARAVKGTVGKYWIDPMEDARLVGIMPWQELSIAK